MSKREDGRLDDELRPVTITRGFTTHPAGSVLVEFGQTRVMCTASVTEGVPRWRAGADLLITVNTFPARALKDYLRGVRADRLRAAAEPMARAPSSTVVGGLAG